jgi:hypothetical protein
MWQRCRCHRKIARSALSAFDIVHRGVQQTARCVKIAGNGETHTMADMEFTVRTWVVELIQHIDNLVICAHVVEDGQHLVAEATLRR